ncbi:T9SS type A sorting domain-containing protein [uncultured Winogradskyella sp.]|uniref:T9SS type A sorting domain-containing protein n=1 Tax=uncultured Winogradskyella sp. TaxID=395353 RepID=UPI0035121443
MKNITYILIVILFNSLNAQNYGFGIIPNGGNSALVQATTNFNGNNVDVSDVGFALLIPTGNTTLTNLSTFNGRVWTVTKITASQLTSLSLGDGSKDLFVLNLAPGQSIISHGIGTSFDLVSFDIINPPNSGNAEFLDNNDAIAIGLGGVANSFFNANIDETTTQDYFGGIVPGEENIVFDTLGVPEITISKNDIKIYPNPFSDVIMIETDVEVISVQIFDTNGRIVLSHKNSKVIPAKSLANGNYLVKVNYNGDYISKKIIKK